MKKLLALCLFVLLICSCQSNEHKSEPIKLGDFTFSSKEITSGTPFTVVYNGQGKLGPG